MANARTLTDLQVRNLKARDSRYFHHFFDGFGLRVTPNGDKMFCYRYSHGGTRSMLTLGRYPAVSLKEALAKHAEARTRVLRGEDPAGPKDAPTVQLLVDEFEREVLSKQPSGTNTLRQIQKDIVPGLGAKTALTDLTRRDAVQIVDAVRKRGDRIGNSAAAILARLGNFAVERGLLPASPFTALKKVRIDPKTRTLSDWEIARLWEGVQRIGIEPLTSLALRLVLATGQRPGEVAGMRQDEIDGALWIIPASRYKTGVEQRVPLSPLALEVLREASVHNWGSAYVFPSPRPGADEAGDPIDHPINRHTLSRAVLRKLGDSPDTDAPAPVADGTLTLAPFTPHDLRRTCRTGMAALGVPEHVAEKVLGHKLEGMMAVYNLHEYGDEKRAALDKWGAHIVRLIEGPQKISDLRT